ncbi:hydrogenase nickel incorporation protein HypB [Spectribacter hydrogenoxidans]|uniref:Hydrogenase maturation factor HypB n=1 Tax=Spectribacter hydrogenoxidans TaxID=3075608 RepID=A0ABU3C4H6_9GAMM|nr:hydrogenase nickel incorporation protein HypB [Salinisphaera sp. W335]MDT0636291.1 hydrogenase nickel incorporation protein HypB [Salinisphaera sp. W335]
MCTTCGCGEGARATVTDLATGKVHPLGAPAHHHHGDDHDHEHDHEHDHHHHGHGHGHGHHHRDHDHGHAHHYQDRDHGRRSTVELEQDVLAKNNLLAERNRGWLEGRNILALNLVSSPGAGKTTLLERTIRDLAGEIPISVVEGDQETLFDAERIRATGCKTVQVNTGTGCHLEAEMLGGALKRLDPPMDSLVLVENVGNLVCPALFDLGEAAKVAILSVTEGADKPLKYPHMFRASSLMLLNKIDLLPHVDFDVDACISHARRVNPDIEVLQLSSTGGQGLEAWFHWLRARLAANGVAAA